MSYWYKSSVFGLSITDILGTNRNEYSYFYPISIISVLGWIKMNLVINLILAIYWTHNVYILPVLIVLKYIFSIVLLIRFSMMIDIYLVVYIGLKEFF